MSLPQKLETCFLNDGSIDIYVPDEQAIQQRYDHNKHEAYWAKVWPASVGLCLFLERQKQLISRKNILELAAGLGLAGLYAASFARQVTITDKEQMAEIFVKKSAQHLGLKNVTTQTLDWNDAQKEPLPDVVLLSDVSYEPAVFKTLQQIIEYFLAHNATVIISTPQRLMAVPFITSLLRYSQLQWNTTVSLNDSDTAVSVYVLKQ